jgi:hypothetical protein
MMLAKSGKVKILALFTEKSATKNLKIAKTYPQRTTFPFWWSVKLIFPLTLMY